MGALNECPKCHELATPAKEGGICAMYGGVCVTCWRTAHPGEELPMPSQEFFPPTRIAESKLFKARLDRIWESMDVPKGAWKR